MPSHRGRERDRRHRSAFTVVEVLVALVLVTVGLLGVAGSGAVSVRVSGAAARERRAVQRAAGRIAHLTSQGCASARSGASADSALRVSEQWTVAAPLNGVVYVDARVNWTTSSGVRTILLNGAILC